MKSLLKGLIHQRTCFRKSRGNMRNMSKTASLMKISSRRFKRPSKLRITGHCQLRSTTTFLSAWWRSARKRSSRNARWVSIPPAFSVYTIRWVFRKPLYLSKITSMRPHSTPSITNTLRMRWGLRRPRKLWRMTTMRTIIPTRFKLIEIWSLTRNPT